MGAEYDEGLRHGLDRDWYESGQRKSEARFRYGGAHGPHRSWYESGELASDERYEHSVLVSRRRYDKRGNSTEAFELTEDHPNFELLRLKRLGTSSSDDSD